MWVKFVGTGMVCDMPQRMAERLCASGVAVPAIEPRIETAMREPRAEAAVEVR